MRISGRATRLGVGRWEFRGLACWASASVNPPGLPAPRCANGLGERDLPDQVLERVKRRTVADNDDGPGESARRLVQPFADARRGLFETLAVWIRRRDVLDPVGLHFSCGPPRQRSVIALAKTRIANERDGARSKRDVRGAKRPGQIRRKHGRDVVAGSPASQLPGLLLSCR